MKGPPQRPKKVKKNNIFTVAAIKTLEIEIQVAWVERDMEKCVELLHKILKFNPHNTDALLLMGRAQGMQFNYDEAIDVFEKAVESAPKHERPIVLLKAGTMATNFYDTRIAESFFEEAIETAGAVPAKLHLAEFSQRIRKRETAKGLINEVLEKAPDNPAAIFLWCQLYEDRHEECVTKLNQILRTQASDLKAKAGYQLAKILDLVGDYDGAMQALVTAKAVLMPAKDIAVQNRVKNRAKLMDLACGCDTEIYTKWRAELDQLNPTRKLALLGGHPRSGTTLLEQVLDSHPGIISAEETEIFFMSSLSPIMRKHPPDTALLKALTSARSDDLLGARDRYFAAMESCLGVPVGSRLLVDKNPSLTALVPALFRIFPEIKFVTVIRDPRDVVLSCFMQSFVPVSGIRGNFLTLEDTATEYAGVMGVWNEVVERFVGNVCEVRYEKMVEDLESNARRILDFLGVEWNESVMDYDRHAREKIVRSPTADAVTEKVHSRAKNRWKNYQKHLEPVLETLAPCLKSLGYD